VCRLQTALLTVKWASQGFAARSAHRALAFANCGSHSGSSSGSHGCAQRDGQQLFLGAVVTEAADLRPSFIASEVAEMALAHAIGDKVEAAYRRGDLFDKRRQLMALCAQHCILK
jgi:hypothetical protein